MSLCHYCLLDNFTVKAVDVAHDRRGCLHVCHKHSAWRETTSCMFGHKDCPEGYPDGVGPVQPHKASGR